MQACCRYFGPLVLILFCCPGCDDQAGGDSVLPDLQLRRVDSTTYYDALPIASDFSTPPDGRHDAEHSSDAQIAPDGRVSDLGTADASHSIDMQTGPDVSVPPGPDAMSPDLDAGPDPLDMGHVEMIDSDIPMPPDLALPDAAFVPDIGFNPDVAIAPDLGAGFDAAIGADAGGPMDLPPGYSMVCPPLQQAPNDVVDADLEL